MTLADKYAVLQELLRGYDRILVCFSGGVDSTFLLKVAADELGDRCFALTCVSETVALSEVEDARRLGEEIGLGDRHHLVESDELAQPGYAENPLDRCAKCKTELMQHAGPLAAELGGAAIALGTNMDDLGDYRPGISAARERGAVAPMVTAGLTKQDIRALSKQLGLRTWNKPQLACLSSRFPYGTRITRERLERIDRFEDGLRKQGFSQLRVRFHDTIARVEISRDEMQRAVELRDDIVGLGKQLGFTYVALDLGGFRSGSLNEASSPGLVSLGTTTGKKAS